MVNLWEVALFFLSMEPERACLEEPALLEVNIEEQETEQLVSFVRLALQEVNRRKLSGPIIPINAERPVRIRITRTLRVFVGHKELKVRPMAKTILLLFLRHPEGIILKDIASYKGEMLTFYRRLMRSTEPEEAEIRVTKILDFFNNDLNVNIARVNAAMNVLVKRQERYLYRIQVSPGCPKTLLLDRREVFWEQ